ncbi:MAG: NAD(P)/FAD-dependent oxidoreductase [Cyclobacteriaceae bacterium]
MHSDVAIIGGGLAGLISAALLAKNGLNVAVFEKKTYPFHRVCGEYISNEVKGFLIRESLYPDELKPSKINNLLLTSTSGNKVDVPLKMGGFGISRFKLDHFLAQKAVAAGCNLQTGIAVESVKKQVDHLQVNLMDGSIHQTNLVIGSFGKRSNLGRNEGNDSTSSPYYAVKYHINTDFPDDLIALHNFKNGYCGLSKVEGQHFNLCYMSHVSNIKKHKTIEAVEENVLYKNPHLKHIFLNSDFLFEKPVTINQISFTKKPLIKDGLIMCGDAAGMITPLCGNGMAMAIHSAKVLSEYILREKSLDEPAKWRIEHQYQQFWNSTYKNRLMMGRAFQRLFGGALTSEIAVGLMKTPLSQTLISLTHGRYLSA